MAGVGEAVALVVAAAVGALVSAAGRAVFTSANANKTKQSLSFMLEPTYRSFREAPAQPRMDANGSSFAPPPYHDATKEKQLPQARIELTGSRRADTELNREWTRMDAKQKQLFVWIRVHSWLRTHTGLEGLWLSRFEPTKLECADTELNREWTRNKNSYSCLFASIRG